MSHLDLLEYVKEGDLESVKSLLNTNSNLVNQRDEVGATPLHYAVLNGNREIARLLIDRGADINCRDTRFGATPAGWAIEFLRELGGLLAIEIDDMAYAIEQNDFVLATRLVGRFPGLREATTSDGVPLKEFARRCSDEKIKALFDGPAS